MAWLVSEARVLASAEVAARPGERRRGLLGRDHLDGALVIEPCCWIHTVGMRFPIDVAYLDASGAVIKTRRMARYRVGLPVRRARVVIEAQAGAFARWGLAVGDVIEVRGDDARTAPPRHGPHDSDGTPSPPNPKCGDNRAVTARFPPDFGSARSPSHAIGR